MDNSIPAAICRYLKKQHVLSLCAGTPPWCANCFYVFNEQQQVFWLMSDAATRHGMLMQAQPLVAGTINGQTRSPMLIKGVQYQGVIVRLAGEQASRARSAYIRRFPIAASAQAPLWEIAIRELKMTDNTLGFGSKLRWQHESV
ncbi:hypothetical protein BL250_01565 [Erwinia sp. OLTSP20]|uniref:YhbP family protein n=1 Tax=unclassified Erwinia TaxID=2622719 RepID=UPI000C17F01C|nr:MULTISPECIES: YhbP family protein [unclassified Erwinia]PIJ51093.1 hypothetical protein BV501_05765 [Erwinia sp. OAMSP11]PIJ73763.1 hypothetical protein BK416_06335 [Erwinia sp. OLSSP12]PIJ83126.1 hypothetical protein BLD47_05830 [Erwinia sp. OLCASP19]PIJ85725.1 hypothetical protein BLD46_05860 [Erwinia sp. OLMTSP26]PIJ87757.1 hypothetical protein BLD49_05255 [Erwinia sp. OLMDSP33]